MDFGIGTYSLGYLAGVLSTLSPCVLPLVPIVLGSAVAAHRLGALALTAGLVLSFTAVGIFVATIGISLGIDATVFQKVAAALLIGAGILLMSATLQARFAVATSGIGNAGQGLLSKVIVEGLWGQFLTGLVLGVIWSPCLGPTLGAAATLASQGTDLVRVSLLMVVFGLGAGTPLVAIGSLSHTRMMKARGRLMSAGRTGKCLLGGMFILLGFLIITELNKDLEAWLVQVSPEWLTNLTTRF